MVLRPHERTQTEHNKVLKRTPRVQESESNNAEKLKKKSIAISLYGLIIFLLRHALTLCRTNCHAYAVNIDRFGLVIELFGKFDTTRDYTL